MCRGTDPAGISTGGTVYTSKHCNKTELFSTGWSWAEPGGPCSLAWWDQARQDICQLWKGLTISLNITGMLPLQNHSGWHLPGENGQAKTEKAGPSLELERGTPKGEAHPNKAEQAAQLMQRAGLFKRAGLTLYYTACWINSCTSAQKRL